MFAGPGFGCQNVTTFKLGAEYQVLKSIKLRAGYNKGDNPVTSRDVTFNILAPSVIRKHYTAGMTYSVTKDIELTASYMQAPGETVRGPSALPVNGSVETIEMHQQALGMSLGVKY